MKIYLLNAPFIDNFVRCGRWQGVAARGGTMYYPIWLSYATGVLEKAGHKVRLIDAIARKWDLENTKEDAKHFNPDLIIIDTNFSCLRNDIDSAIQLQETTGAPSAMVGPPVSQFSDEILDKGVNFAARFEFDFTLRDLAGALDDNKSFDNVMGLSYKKNGHVIHNPDRAILSSKDLDEIPFVSEVYKKHLNMSDYFLNHSLYPMVQIFTGRGCPNLCTFCSWPETLMGRKYRTRSIKNVVDEFEYIIKEFPVKEIFIEDDSFTLNKKRLIQFCKEIEDRKINIPWSCQSRATLDLHTMTAMKRAGCRLLDVGYESGSNKILTNIKKSITVEQFREFTNNAKKAKLKILADFVIGFPGEDKETAEQTIQFAKEIRPDLLQVAIATPLPGTEFYNWCKENGYLLTEDLRNSLDSRGYQKCIVSYPWLNEKEIQEYVDLALKSYYLNINYIPIALKLILGKNGFHELKVMAKSAKIFLNYIG